MWGCAPCQGSVGALQWAQHRGPVAARSVPQLEWRGEETETRTPACIWLELWLGRGVEGAAWRPEIQRGDTDGFAHVTGVLNISLAVGRFEGTSQGRGKAVPMCLVPSLEKEGCGSPTVQ